MEKLLDLKWNAIPKHIIISIGVHLPLFFQMELRSLNKHWKKNLNNLAFHSIDSFKPEKAQAIMKSYGLYIRIINSSFVQMLELSELKQLCPNINHIILILLKSTINRSLELIQNFNNLTKLEIFSYLEFAESSISPLTDFINFISQQKSLKYLSFSSTEEFKHSLPKFNTLPNLKKLEIICNSLDLDKFLSEYSKLKDLRKTHWTIEYYGNESVTKDREKLSTPITYLIHSNLKSLCLWSYSYSDDGDSIEHCLSKELIKVFSNSNFINLTSLEWMFLRSGNIATNILFINELPKTQHWPNLTKLSLFCMDGYLLTYIIEHCPNLVQLVIISPLTLPKHDNSLKLKPLYKLKRLLIGGFDKKIIDNEAIICNLFPSVVTLNINLNLATHITENTSIDIYYIPMLFPNLKFCILASPEYDLNNLISNYQNNLSWEELYIEINDTSSHLLEALLDKLPNIKIVYLNLRSINNLFTSKSEGIRFFTVYRSDGMELNFNNIKEIK